MPACSRMGGRISSWGWWEGRKRLARAMGCCWAEAAPQNLALTLPVSPPPPPSPRRDAVPEPAPSLSVQALVSQHLPWASNPPAPQRPAGCQPPIDSSFVAYVAIAAPQARGEGAQAQHGGFWVRQGGTRRIRGEDREERRGEETNPSCSWAVRGGAWGGKVGAAQCPPRTRVGCFTFFPAKKSAQKSLPEPILLVHWTTASPHSPQLPLSPTGSGAASSEGWVAPRDPRELGLEAPAVCCSLGLAGGWVTGAGSAVSGIPQDGKLSLNRRGHLAL